MISQKLQDAINYQINRELFSEYYYLSMASYFNSAGLSGFVNFFLIQVEEERFHAMKIVSISKRKGRAGFSCKPLKRQKLEFKYSSGSLCNWHIHMKRLVSKD